VGSCELSNRFLGFIKGEEFVNKLSNSQLHKKKYVPCISSDTNLNPNDKFITFAVLLSLIFLIRIRIIHRLNPVVHLEVPSSGYRSGTGYSRSDIAFPSLCPLK
jgi:hypothetical protein